jgi:hypothetical protein
MFFFSFFFREALPFTLAIIPPGLRSRWFYNHSTSPFLAPLFFYELWNVGMMEWWNNGYLSWKCDFGSFFIFPIIPVFQHSSIPLAGTAREPITSCVDRSWIAEVLFWYGHWCVSAVHALALPAGDAAHDSSLNPLAA